MKRCFFIVLSLSLIGMTSWAYNTKSGSFTINAEGQTVVFAPGNLQYQASTGTWRFAEHQYDYVGDSLRGNVYVGAMKCDNRLVSSLYNGWIDLFRYGTSGWNNGSAAYMPYSTNDNSDDFMPYGIWDERYHNLYGAYAKSDWGIYNQIGNDAPGTWRTPTKEEWEYIFSTRPNAANLRGQASIVTYDGTINGYILFPDSFVMPQGLTFVSKQQHGSDLYYETNVYSLAEWIRLENAGAVFFPAAGISSWNYRESIGDIMLYGHYWSSSCRRPVDSGNDAHSFSFCDSWDQVGYYWWCSGLSVRLISNNNAVVVPPPTGEPKVGYFTTSDSTSVHFAPGNLQYQASTDTWRFAEHPYDYVGGVQDGKTYGTVFENGVKSDNDSASATYSGWIDMYNYGTSGWNSGANLYMPYNSSSNSNDFRPEGVSDYYLIGRYANADWGVYNQIGEYEPGTWRTPTRAEWDYIFNTRPNAANLRAHAEILTDSALVRGYILLPDSFVMPSHLSMVFGQQIGYAANRYTLEDWAFFEHQGAVFLPASGSWYDRYYNYNGSGYYWASTGNYSSEASRIWFDIDYAQVENSSFCYKHAVRLIYDPKPKECGENLVWDIVDSVLTITGTGAMTNWESRGEVPWYARRASIASVVISDGVTNIGDYAFAECDHLRSVSIPTSVTIIGKEAFIACGSLKSVTIPTSVQSLGESAFGATGLTSVTIPGNVTSIGSLAFAYSGLTSVTIENGVTSIGWRAFNSCGMSSVTIPASVTSIAEASFAGCSNLTSIVVAADNPLYDSRNGCNAIIESGSRTLIAGCKTSVIPENIRGLANNAFDGSGITSLFIPASIIRIGLEAFSDNQQLAEVFCFASPQSLTWADPNVGFKDNKATIFHVTDASAWQTKFPNANVTFVGDLATYMCGENVTWKLQNDTLIISGSGAMYDWESGENIPWHELRENIRTVIISNGVTRIGKNAFNDSYNLTSAYIPNSVTSIGPGGFFLCRSLTSVTIPNSVTRIEESAFNASGLTSVTIPGSVTEMGSFAFIATPLTSVTIENGATEIGAAAFCDCGLLTSVTIPNSVTTIGGDAFTNCAITSIELSNNLSHIGGGAFGSCRRLTSVTIPSSVTTIDNNPFGGCSNLTSIIVDSNNPKYDSRNNCNAIIETASNKLISGCQNTIFPANITTIEKEAFVGCTGLTSITIPNSVRKIGERAFWGCSGLTSVIISSGVRTIEGEAFLDCPRIASIVVDPNNPIFDSRDSCNAIIEKATNKLIVGCAGTTFPTSITTIGDYALRGCGIRTINVPNNVTHIGTDAFRECDSLVSAILPNSITSISNCLFCWCHNLTSVTIPNSVTSIGEDAFAECGFTSIIIPNSVTSLSTNAFVWCRSLMSVTIPSSVTFIGENAFTGCSEVYDVYCSANPANLTWINFNNCFRENKNTVCHVYDASAWQTKFPDANVTFVGDLSNYMCGENVSWDLADGVLTISGSGPMFDYEIVENTPWYDQRATIQSIVIEEGVTTIGNNAFKTCGATSVTIPNSVTRLGSQAFRGCNALTSVMIPRGVTTIGEGDEVFGDCPSITSIVVDSLNPVFDSRGGCNAIIETATNKLIVGCRNTVIPEGIVSIGGFGGSRITTISIPNSVTTLATGAFHGCNLLTSITLPDSLTTISSNVFVDCGLRSITIPRSVEFIGSDAFHGCENMDSVVFIHSTPPTIQCTSSFINTNCNFYVPCGTATAYVSALNRDVCPVYEEYSIAASRVIETSMFPYSFAVSSTDTTLGNVVVTQEPTCANSTMIIQAVANDNQMFSMWSDGNTDNPRSVVVTQDTSFVAEFERCYIAEGTCGAQLTWKLYCDSVLEISGSGPMFNWESDTIVPWYSQRASISSVVIEDGVTTIGNQAFAICGNLESISIPNSVTRIGVAAFDGSGLKSISIPNSITRIEDLCFYGCARLKSIDIPNSVTSVGWAAFYFCTQLDSLVLPESLISIEQGAFDGCVSVKSLIIPASVTSIAWSAFSSCSGLTSIIVEEENTVYDSRGGCNAIIETATNKLIEGCKNTVIPTSVTTIGDRAFWNRGLASITIPNNVTSIEHEAFAHCGEMTTITIPASVATIGDFAFMECTGLTSVTFTRLTPPEFATTGCFYNTTCDFYVPCVSKDAYVAALNDSITRDYPIAASRVIQTDAFPYVSTLAVNEPGAGTVTMTQEPTCEDPTLIVLATAAEHRHFVSWADGITTNPRTLTIDKDTTVTAVFELDKYAVSATMNNGVVQGIGEYDYGTNVTLTAVPDAHYHFVEWQDNHDTNPVREVLVTEAISLVAVAAIDTHTVSLSATNGVISGEGTYEYGSVIQISATADPHYHFVRWSDNVTDNPRSLTVEKDTVLTAIFELDKHTVSATMNNGTVLGTGEYEYGTNATLTAVPDEHYHFVEWQDTHDTNPTRVVTVDGTIALVAVAEIDKHTVNVSAVNGSVSGAGNYDYGSIVTLAAVPADHYHFVRWRDGNTTNPRTLTLTQDTSLVAEFEIDKHHISVSAVNGQVQGDGIYDYGQVITLTAVPNVHYHFADWQDNHSSDNPRSVVVERDFTYIANFAPDAYILTVHAEHGTISGAGDHLYGELFTISATPMDHYHFVRWSDGNVSNPRTMTLDKDSTITAVFVLDRHTVTATMNNGTVLGTGEYEYGTNITLTAVPNEHYHFVEWQDNHDTNPTRGITVTGSMNLVAIAAGDVHTITASATHGTIIGGGEFGYGATTTLTVVPDDHFHFIAWTDGDKANPRRLTVLGDAVYHAICAIDTLKVDTFAVHGYITGGGMYEYGSYVILEAIPFEGFKFDRWSDGSTYNPNVIFLENNITIGAYFVPIQEDLESMDTDGFSAYAVDKTLYVNNGNAPYTIINVNGRIVYQGRDAVVELPCGGIYVVLSGYKAIKVIAQ